MQVRAQSNSKNQDFMWVAEYSDGRIVREVDDGDVNYKKLRNIDQKDMIRFGMVGLGYKSHIEVYGGFIIVDGELIEIIYRTVEKDYYLTGQPWNYQGACAFKEGESTRRISSNFSTDSQVDRISSYNIGYHTLQKIEGVTFNFRLLYSIPYNAPAYINLLIAGDRALDGQIVIKKRGAEVAIFPADIELGYAGDINWVVR